MGWWNKLIRDAGIKAKIDEPEKTPEDLRREALAKEKDISPPPPSWEQLPKSFPSLGIRLPPLIVGRCVPMYDLQSSMNN